MTDHNAEGGKKPAKMVIQNYHDRDVVEPCAWCGKEPYESCAEGDYCRGGDLCRPDYGCNCELSDIQSLSRVGWNDKQRAILAQRRKDFEAGQESMLSPGEFVDTSVATSFDEYLAKSRK